MGALTWTTTDVTTCTSWDAPGLSAFQSGQAMLIGSASPDRIVVICAVVAGLGGSTDFTSVTINGNPAIQAIHQTQTTVGCSALGIYYCPVATGTTATFTVSVSGSPFYMFATAGIITGDINAVLLPGTNVPWSTPPDPQTITATVPVGGVGVICADPFNVAGSPPTGISGAVLDEFFDDGGATSNFGYAMFHGTASTVSWSGWNGSNQMYSMASFGPSAASPVTFIGMASAEW